MREHIPERASQNLRDRKTLEAIAREPGEETGEDST